MAARPAAGVPAQGPALKVSPPLRRSFFGRPAPVVARDLLGRLLVRRLASGELLVGRIVECEAYQEDDPASHSFGGPRGRNLVMFGPPGHLYVYFTYGMHFCMNVVTGRAGEGSAVLLRAVEPLDGLAAMRARRGDVPDRSLCAGPGRLAQAFQVGREMNGLDLVAGTGLWLARGTSVPELDVGVGPRIGIRAGTEVPWRFVETRSGFLSRRVRASGRAERPSVAPARPR